MSNIDSLVQQVEMTISGQFKPSTPLAVARQGYAKGSVLGDRDISKIYNSKNPDAIKIKNALGIDVDITTLTDVLQGVVEQKVYQVNIADFVTIKTGQGAWMEDLLKWRTYNLANNDISKGDLSLGNGKIASVDAAADSIRIPLQKWAIDATYTLFEIKQASVTRVWDKVEQLEKSKRMQWDTGLEKFTFLGHPTNSNMKGLLNQSGVTANTALITKKLSSMTAAELTAFVGAVIGAYFTNSNSTMKPNTFVMPSDDFLGMTAPYSSDFPVGGSRLEYLEKAFKQVCGPDFKILDVAFASQVNNNLSKNRYAMYHRGEDNIAMFLPIPYTTALQGTADNFNFVSISYAQYGPVQLFRPASMLYMDFAN